MVPPFTKALRAALLMLALGVMAGILGMHALAGGGALPAHGPSVPASAAIPHSLHDGAPDATGVAVPNVRHSGTLQVEPASCIPSGHGGHDSVHSGCDPAPPAPGPALRVPPDRSAFSQAQAPDVPCGPAATGRIPDTPTLEQLSVRRT